MKKRLLWLSALLAVVLGMFIAFPFFLEGTARFLIVQDKLEAADVIVVLAGDNNGERVDEAVKLYKKGYAKKLLMSGGPLAWKLTHAQWMKRQAARMGVPKASILLQEQSESTLEDAKFTLPIIKKYGFKSVILVTSPTHTRRAKRVFRKMYAGQGIKVLVYPVQDSKFKLQRWWSRHEDTQRVIWEYVSFVYYFFKGY
jgi:uncharacterized SAM-binding protein YcdF (DUF218 family)